jgi:hypothetical protein
MRCWRGIYRALRARVKSRDEANLEKLGGGRLAALDFLRKILILFNKLRSSDWQLQVGQAVPL